MQKLTAYLKKLRLGRVLSVFLAGVLLIVTTACNNGDLRGARPDNPPVQAGGRNNPHMAGGDNYTNYKMSTDPKVNSKTSNEKGYHSDLQLISPQLIAANRDSEILYPDADNPRGRVQKEKELPQITQKNFERSEPGGLNQRNSDVGERVENRLETVQDTFEKASEFVKDTAAEAEPHRSY